MRSLWKFWVYTNKGEYTDYYDVLSGGSPEEPKVVVDDEDLGFILQIAAGLFVQLIQTYSVP